MSDALRMTCCVRVTVHTTARAPWNTVLPLMGRLRRDGVSVEHLAGASAQPPIVRPVELTSVPDKWEMRSFEDVAAAMQRAVHVCNLLANQRDVLKNTYLLRVTLLTHFFTRVLPMPMPNGDIRAAVHCFWQGDARPMRYETQSHILKQVSCRVIILLLFSITAARYCYKVMYTLISELRRVVCLRLSC
jgi:hypothetical protein